MEISDLNGVPRRAPRTRCGGVPLGTVGAARCGAMAGPPTATLPEIETVKAHQSKAKVSHSIEHKNLQRLTEAQARA